MAQLALGIAGGIVGGMIGGPIGWSIGFLAGSALGAALDPETTHGPRLSDLHIQGSSYGAPIPIIWPGEGMRFAGNIIDRPAEFDEHEQSSGGKGGPEVVNHTYTIAFLRILIGEAFGNVTLGRVWINGQLEGDYREGAANAGELPIIFYDGNANQLPDPTEEAIRGVGMVPAYRGVASVVLTAWDITKWGVIPQLNFELLNVTPTVAGPISAVMQKDDEPYAWPVYPDYHYTNNDTPPHPAIMTFPRNGSNIRIRVRNNLTVKVYSSVDLSFIDTEAVGDDDGFPGDAAFYPGAEFHSRPLGTYVYDDDSTTFLWTLPSKIIKVGIDQPVISNTQYTSAGPSISGSNWAVTAGLPLGEYLSTTTISQDGRIALVMTAPSAAGNADKWYRIVNGIVASSGTVSPVLNFLADGPSSAARGAGRPHAMSLENNGRWLWFFAGNTEEVKLYYIDDAGNLAFNVAGGTFETHGGGGYLAAGSIQTLSNDGYAGLAYYTTLALLTRLVPSPNAPLLLSDIASKVCQLDGLTAAQIDVTDIEIPVRCYALTQTPITGRAALESILPAFYVDVVDSDKIKFVRRNRIVAPVVVPNEDLAVHLEDEELPARLQVIRGNDEALPSHMILNYINVNADNLIGTQQWRRQTGHSKVVTTINAPIGFIDAEAKSIVDSWGQTAWLERDDYVWYTLRKYIKYEPTDVMRVEGIDLRVTNKTEGAKGVIKWEGKKHRPGIYAQTGVAGEAEGFVPSEIPVPQQTELEVIDAPYIVDEFRQAVIQVGMQGALRRSWPGAALMKSIDGTNYSQLLVNTAPDTIGETLTALANFGGGNVFDYSSSVEVEIGPGGGELSSSTEYAVLAGANECMIGAEVLQYVDAELIAANTYRLCNGLLRGRRGTEWAMRGHAVGDLFIVLPTKTTIDALYADYGLTRQYKAVTLGRTLASAGAVEFRSNGVSVAPYSPVHLTLGFNGAGDVLMTCFRRARIHGAWLDWVDVPLDEATESYRYQVWEDGSNQTVVRDIIVTGSPDGMYTVAQQTIDFGAGLFPNLPSISGAQIGRLGPGYDTLGRLPDFVPVPLPGYVPPNPPPADGIRSTMTWASSAQVFSGPMAPNDVWIIQFTTASVSSTLGDRPSLTAVEFGGPTAPREWVLSLVAGDFFTGDKKAFAHSSGSSTVFCVFGVGTDTDASYPIIPLNTTAYLNIRNLPSLYTDVPMVCNLANVP